jgi:cytochrome c oxidase subunit III
MATDVNEQSEATGGGDPTGFAGGVGGNAPRGVNVRELGFPPPKHDLLYWGIWWLIIIELVVFSSFAASHLYLGARADNWPPAGVDPPKLMLATINTAILLGCLPFVKRADTAAKQDDRRKLSIAVAVSLVGALIFVVIKTIEFINLDYRWDTHAFGSAYYALTGFHFLHVIVLVLKTSAVLVLSLRGHFGADRKVGVIVNGLYWYFVVLIWLPIYTIVFLLPRVLW